MNEKIILNNKDEVSNPIIKRLLENFINQMKNEKLKQSYNIHDSEESHENCFIGKLVKSNSKWFADVIINQDNICELEKAIENIWGKLEIVMNKKEKGNEKKTCN